MPLPIHHIVAGGPRPVAPFSHAVEADGFVFVTGQMPFNALALFSHAPNEVTARERSGVPDLKASE